MAKLSLAFIFLSLASAICVGYQIQDTVDQGTSAVSISIDTMIGTCRSENATYKPVIIEFVFNFWTAQQCYQSNSTSEYPHLFNALLTAMRRCLRPCRWSKKRYTLPTIPCSNQSIPNTLAINYQCRQTWQSPIDVHTTTPVTTTTRTTHRSVTSAPDMTTEASHSSVPEVLRSTQTRWQASTQLPTATTTRPTNLATTTQTKPDGNEEHALLAVDEEGTSGYLTTNLSYVVCNQISDLHVTNLKTEIDQGHPCPSTLDTHYIEEQLHTNHSFISQPNCSDNAEKVHRLTIYYNCMEQDPEGTKAELTPSDREGKKENNLTLILAIAIPLFLMLLIIPTVAFIIYKRRNKIKVLLSTRTSAYDRDEGVYVDPSQTFNYSQMNSAYSNEHLDDNAMYQDPALILRPPSMSAMKMKRHKNSVKSMDSDYQDPSTLACTGPPGTPSPIRDALETAHEDPSSASEIYTDIDAKGTLPRNDQNIYDLPCVVVARQGSTESLEDQAGNNAEVHSLSQPSYTHMIVTDGQMEPHNYAIIRNPKAYRDSQYYDLENEVQLYDSPVYNSTEDISDSANAENSSKDEVF